MLIGQNRKINHFWLAEGAALGWLQDGMILSRIFKHSARLCIDFFGIWLQLPQICDEKEWKQDDMLKRRYESCNRKIISVENWFKNCIRHLRVCDETHSWRPATAATDWSPFHLRVHHQQPRVYLWKEDIYFALRKKVTFNRTKYFYVVCCYIRRVLACEAARRGKLQNVQAVE